MAYGGYLINSSYYIIYGDDDERKFFFQYFLNLEEWKKKKKMDCPLSGMEDFWWFNLWPMGELVNRVRRKKREIKRDI